MYKHLTISQLEISSFAWPKYAFKARLLPESTLFQFLLKKEQLNYKMEIFFKDYFTLVLKYFGIKILE